MTEAENYSRIEKLKKNLYRRQDQKPSRRSKLSSSDHQMVKKSWIDKPKQKTTGSNKPFINRWLIRILIFSLIFFIGALSVAGYILFKGGNIISKDNIDLIIQGPATIKAGDETAFQIVIANRNKVPLEEVEMTIEYPSETKNPENINRPLTRTTEEIGIINSGETINKTARAILFGPEKSEQEIKVKLQYRIPGSAAFYLKEGIYKLRIDLPPIVLSVSTLKEVIAGQEASFEIRATSNSQTTLTDILMVVNYPSGFDFGQAEPAPSLRQNVWSLGDILPGDQKVIKLKGSVDGQDEEVKPFQFFIGRRDEINDDQIAFSYGEAFETIIVKKPFISAVILVNGDSSPESVSASGLVRVDIDWFNNLPYQITDGEIEINFPSKIVDQRSVSADRGFYDSVNNKISWDKYAIPALGSIAPGARGRLSFTFNILPLTRSEFSGLRQPVVDLSLAIRGTRISEGFSSEVFESSANHRIKVESALQVAAAGYYQSGPLINTGPLPPKIGSETTYTISWAVLNSSNDVNSATVKTVLPPYVTWLGDFEPTDENIVYDEVNRQVVWNLGNVAAGTGITSSLREANFRVALNPSLSQLGQVVNLTGPIDIFGNDTHTNTKLSSSLQAITTNLISEEGFVRNMGIISE